jgi:hypothetical protein
MGSVVGVFVSVLRGEVHQLGGGFPLDHAILLNESTHHAWWEGIAWSSTEG